MSWRVSVLFLGLFLSLVARGDQSQQEDSRTGSFLEGNVVDPRLREGQGPQEPRLDHQYFRGGHLIYDCVRGFFACVNQDGFTECGNRRERAREEFFANLHCAPLKSFEDEDQCIEQQKKLVLQLTHKSFCVQDVTERILRL
jgi:hypothetical protein